MQLILTEPTTGVSVDIKKRRIRISRKIFQQLNMPEYFRILVNPSSKGMVIEGCPEAAKGAYQLSKVPTHRTSDKHQLNRRACTGCRFFRTGSGKADRLSH